jgi:hypothetical protein
MIRTKVAILPNLKLEDTREAATVQHAPIAVDASAAIQEDIAVFAKSQKNLPLHINQRPASQVLKNQQDVRQQLKRYLNAQETLEATGYVGNMVAEILLFGPYHITTVRIYYFNAYLCA